MRYCFQVRTKDDTYFRATSLEILRNMVAAGSSITLLPNLSVPKEIKCDVIYYLNCINPVPSRSVVLIYRPGSSLRSYHEQLAEAIRKQIY